VFSRDKVSQKSQNFITYTPTHFAKKIRDREKKFSSVANFDGKQ